MWSREMQNAVCGLAKQLSSDVLTGTEFRCRPLGLASQLHAGLQWAEGRAVRD